MAFNFLNKSEVKTLASSFFIIMLFFQSGCTRVAYEKNVLLLDRDYYPQVKRLINNAKKSIHLMMFEASYYKKYPESPSNQLIRALINAKKRGVSVEVILEVKNKNERTTKRNLETGRILQKEGIDVIVDPEDITTHTKLIIIDGRIIILGSTNWTFNALNKNHEISTVIHSEETAEEVLDYFQMVKNSGKNLKTFN